MSYQISYLDQAIPVRARRTVYLLPLLFVALSPTIWRTSLAIAQQPRASENSKARVSQEVDRVYVPPGGSIVHYQPGYMFVSELAKELNLSPEQLRNLLAISAEYQADVVKKLQKQQEMDGPRTSGTGANGDSRRSVLAIEREQRKIARKRVEGVLTVQQLDDYKRRVFPARAYDILQDARTSKAIAATPLQCKEFRELVFENELQHQLDNSHFAEKALATLSADQNEALRIVVEKGNAGSGAGILSTGGTLIANFGGGATSQMQFLDLELPRPYDVLGIADARKQLRLGARKEARFREISKDFATEITKLSGEKLKPEELAQRRKEIDSRFRTELASEVTPKQLSDTKRLVYLSVAASALSGPEIQARIGVTARQKAQLARAVEDFQSASKTRFRAVLLRAVAIFTAAQQRELRAELDKLDAW